MGNGRGLYSRGGGGIGYYGRGLERDERGKNGNDFEIDDWSGAGRGGAPGGMTWRVEIQS